MTAAYEAGWFLAERDGKTLRLQHYAGALFFCIEPSAFFAADELTDIRPAIVLDPNDTDVRKWATFTTLYPSSYLPDFVTVARQIVAQMTKPKPPEPAEFGSVVRDSDDRLWLLSRVDGGRDRAWVTDDSTAGHVWRAFYANINVVEVVRVGLS